MCSTGCVAVVALDCNYVKICCFVQVLKPSILQMILTFNELKENKNCSGHWIWFIGHWIVSAFVGIDLFQFRVSHVRYIVIGHPTPEAFLSVLMDG